MFLISSKFFAIPYSYKLGDKCNVDKIEEKYAKAIFQSFELNERCGNEYNPLKDIKFNKKISIIFVESNVGLNIERIISLAKTKIDKNKTILLDEFIKNRLRFIYLDDLEYLLLTSTSLSKTMIPDPWATTKSLFVNVIVDDGKTLIDEIKTINDFFAKRLTDFAKENFIA